MAAFTLDTSGRVHVWGAENVKTAWRTWEDLTPFAQGYVGAASEELQRTLDAQSHGLWMRVGFANWSPEALAQIIADCERAADSGESSDWPDANDGRDFHFRRQGGQLGRFPPSTPYLGDDGRVYLKEAA